MPALYLNRGAPRNLGRKDWVFRDMRWVRDTQALQGDVYPATPDEARRFAHKLVRVEDKAYPPIPGAGEVEDAGPSGADATAVSVDAEPAPPSGEDAEEEDEGPDVVDVELYRVVGSSYYDLPNGERVNGRAAALRALGVDDGG